MGFRFRDYGWVFVVVPNLSFTAGVLKTLLEVVFINIVRNPVASNVISVHG